MVQTPDLGLLNLSYWISVCRSQLGVNCQVEHQLVSLREQLLLHSVVGDIALTRQKGGKNRDAILDGTGSCCKRFEKQGR